MTHSPIPVPHNLLCRHHCLPRMCYDCARARLWALIAMVCVLALVLFLASCAFATAPEDARRADRCWTQRALHIHDDNTVNVDSARVCVWFYEQQAPPPLAPPDSTPPPALMPKACIGMALWP